MGSFLPAGCTRRTNELAVALAESRVSKPSWPKATAEIERLRAMLGAAAWPDGEAQER